MPELKVAPMHEQPERFEATPFHPGDGIDFHATSEGIGSYEQGHALAQAAALDQQLSAGRVERREANLPPEIAYLKQASQLLTGFRRLEQSQQDSFDVAA